MVLMIGNRILLRSDPALGDYSGSVVTVEAGPRSEPPNVQWRVSWGPGPMEVDWVANRWFRPSGS